MQVRRRPPQTACCTLSVSNCNVQSIKLNCHLYHMSRDNIEQTKGFLAIHKQKALFQEDDLKLDDLTEPLQWLMHVR